MLKDLLLIDAYFIIKQDFMIWIYNKLPDLLN